MKTIDNIKEECGLFGIFNNSSSLELTYVGLHSLQHRGQEACGIVYSDGQLEIKKGLGLVRDVFGKNIVDTKSSSGIGHVRYSTNGGSGAENIQPFLFRHSDGDFAIAHNGNIVNANIVRHQLEKDGSLFQSSSDSEILAHLIKKSHSPEKIKAIKNALQQIDGGFAFLILTNNKLYACRDKNGLKPLSLGKINNSYIVASESCAFDSVGAEFIRDIEAGEIVTISQDGISSDFYCSNCKQCMCAMEYIYFSRPDSVIEGISVHEFRKKTGELLAEEAPIEADIVIGVPESSLSAAIGYSQKSKIPFDYGLIKHKYSGRTFIEPTQELREKSVKLKLSAIKSVITGKRIILVDDSIVRGTTIRRIVNLLRQAGAKEVHVRIACPELISPCFYGVNISSKEELISCKRNCTEIKTEIGADSLAFLQCEKLFYASNRKELCTSCFTGIYPTKTYGNI